MADNFDYVPTLTLDGGSSTPAGQMAAAQMAEAAKEAAPTLTATQHQEAQLTPEELRLEITESAYVDNDSVADTVQRLREKYRFRAEKG